MDSEWKEVKQTSSICQIRFNQGGSRKLPLPEFREIGYSDEWQLGFQNGQQR